MELPEVQNLQIDSIRENPRNPRTGHDVDAIARSISELGWHAPLVAMHDGTLLIGHGRLKAARKLGLDTVPVLKVDDDDSMAIKRMIVDNRLTELSHWDLEELSSLTEDLGDWADDLKIDDIIDDITTLPSIDLAKEKDLRTTFQVIVDFENENQQDAFLEEMLDRGFKCRALII